MKPSRNDPCPCGSGKKFKKCCIDTWEAEHALEAAAAAAPAPGPTAEESTRIVMLYNAGNTAELEPQAQALIERYPQSGLAWKLWGATLQLLGRDSVPALQQAQKLRADDAEIWNLLGMAHSQLGQKTEAAASYQQALALNPALTATLCNLASVQTDLNLNAEAETNLRRALAIAPDLAEAWLNLGALQKKLNRTEEALQSALTAIKCKPGMADAHFNAGNALFELKRQAEAETCFRNALALQPAHAHAAASLANILAARGEPAQAEQLYRQAMQHNPLFTEAHLGLSSMLFELGRLDEAEAVLRQILQIKPGDWIALSNLGPVLTRLGRLDEAVLCFQQSLQINPAHANAYNGLGVTLNRLGRQAEGEAAYRQAMQLDQNDLSAHSNLLSTLNFRPAADDGSGNNDNDDIIALARAFDRKFCLPHRHALPPHANSRDPGRRLRIGYVSPDFRHHAVAYFMEPILANHDKSQVEIFCYADERKVDDFTERFRTLADGWRSTRGLSDDALARAIRADQIDILIDLTGHTEGNRLPAFARKPAPVQMTYLGYPGATGLSAIDYRIVDAQAAPAGMAEAQYTETLLRMPDSLWCYRPPAHMPEPSPLPALANGYLTFGSFNNFNKIDQPTLALWAELLRHLPTARLMMLTVPAGEARQRLTQQFAGQGVAAERLEFHGKVAFGEFHQKFRQVDMSLDPLNVNGATTTCESLWMGVPVISLVGRRFLTRAGLSLLSAAGAPEFAVQTRADYLRIAADMHADLPRLAAIRTGLRERLRNSALTDEQRFTRNLENLYREAWSRWCAGS